MEDTAKEKQSMSAEFRSGPTSPIDKQEVELTDDEKDGTILNKSKRKKIHDSENESWSDASSSSASSQSDPLDGSDAGSDHERSRTERRAQRGLRKLNGNDSQETETGTGSGTAHDDATSASTEKRTLNRLRPKSSQDSGSDGDSDGTKEDVEDEEQGRNGIAITGGGGSSTTQKDKQKGDTQDAADISMEQFDVDRSLDDQIANHSDFAVVCSFLIHFGELVGYQFTSQQLLEIGLQSIDPLKSMIALHITLLRKLNKRNVTPENWEKQLRTLVDERWRFLADSVTETNPWSSELMRYEHLNAHQRLRFLKALCEWQFDENEKLIKHIRTDIEPQSLRVPPFGKDAEGNHYWYVDDEEGGVRVYRESAPIRPNPSPSPSKPSKQPSSATTPASISGEHGVKAVDPELQALYAGPPRDPHSWDLLCRNLDELESVLVTMEVSLPPVDTVAKSNLEKCAVCKKVHSKKTMAVCGLCGQHIHPTCLESPKLVAPPDYLCKPCIARRLTHSLRDLKNTISARVKQRERASRRMGRLGGLGGIDLKNILADEEEERLPRSQRTASRRDDKLQQQQQEVRQRSVRARKQVNYSYDEYDKQIKESIYDLNRKGTKRSFEPTTEPTRRLSRRTDTTAHNGQDQNDYRAHDDEEGNENGGGLNDSSISLNSGQGTAMHDDEEEEEDGSVEVEEEQDAQSPEPMNTEHGAGTGSDEDGNSNSNEFEMKMDDSESDHNEDE